MNITLLTNGFHENFSHLTLDSKKLASYAEKLVSYTSSRTFYYIASN